MRFLPKKFFDNGAEGGNSGGADAPPATGNEGGENKGQIEQPIFTNDELKNYGFDSPEALKTFLQKQKEENISPEEKLQKENITKANFLKFSAEQKLLNVDELTAYESLKSKPDEELVFDSFLKDYKEDHPEITDEKELEDAAKEDFDYEYKRKEGLTETAKKKGLEKLARDAKALRSPVESKVTEAQNKFKEFGTVQETYPKFEKFIKESILKNTPEKLVAYKHKEGETELEIDVPLTQADRDAMFKEFSTPKTFNKFLNAKPEEIQAILDKKMQGWLFQNKREAIMSRGIEVGKGLGTKEGSNIGAENPFSMRKGDTTIVSNSESLQESNKKLSAQRQKLKATR